MSTVTDSDMGGTDSLRNPLVIAGLQVIAYFTIIMTAFFVISTGVKPVLPWGVAFVAFVAILRVLKRTAALLFSEKKARRQRG